MREGDRDTGEREVGDPRMYERKRGKERERCREESLAPYTSYSSKTLDHPCLIRLTLFLILFLTVMILPQACLLIH